MQLLDTKGASERRAERNAMIAATAFVQLMKVVTRNVVDFDQSMVEVAGPWGGDV